MNHDDRFRYHSDCSDAYAAAVDALKALVEAEDIDVAYRAAAEALSGPKETEWRKHEGMSRCKAKTHWRGLLGQQPEDFEDGLPGDDHTSLWSKNGKPRLYVSQPYRLEFETTRDMVRKADEHSLEFSIHPNQSWHFPGYSTAVVWKRRTPGGSNPNAKS